MSLLSEFSLWTWVLIGIIVLLTLYFHLFRYSARTAEAGPAILTSIGIFGTFLGVALGLANFDTAHLQDSVPQLLEGLKTAFWSSIVGLLGALTLKFRSVLDLTRQESGSKRQVTSSIDDLHDRLAGVEKSLKDEQGEILANSLALMRIEHKRQNEDLIHTMTHYQDRMVQANTEALVGAIQHVMREFNTRINEQYGDNFKRLNESVGRMLDWQVQYKDQLNELASNQQKIGKSMMDASAAFENMVSHAQAFNGISDSLGDMLKGLNVQREVLDQHLGGLAQLVNDAAEGLPKLEDRITFLTKGLGEHLTAYHQNMERLIRDTGKQITGTTAQLGESLQTSYEQAFSQLDRRLESAMLQTDKQLSKLDAGMEQELNKALKTLGQQLAALSEKFVQDYSPLTERLKEVVELAKHVK
ncbi:MAG: hypothetical protein H7A10_01685 [Oceanospirillaceae bacterium]|nr:hypothetical protein [Oceanospirillaceae bacterium]